MKCKMSAVTDHATTLQKKLKYRNTKICRLKQKCQSMCDMRFLDDPQPKFFFARSEYFGISNCVFNFNILALVLSETLGGSQANAQRHSWDKCSVQ